MSVSLQILMNFLRLISLIVSVLKYDKDNKLEHPEPRTCILATDLARPRFNVASVHCIALTQHKKILLFGSRSANVLEHSNTVAERTFVVLQQQNRLSTAGVHSNYLVNDSCCSSKFLNLYGNTGQVSLFEFEAPEV